MDNLIEKFMDEFNTNRYWAQRALEMAAGDYNIAAERRREQEIIWKKERELKERAIEYARELGFKFEPYETEDGDFYRVTMPDGKITYGGSREIWYKEKDTGFVELYINSVSENTAGYGFQVSGNKRRAFWIVPFGIEVSADDLPDHFPPALNDTSWEGYRNLLTVEEAEAYIAERKRDAKRSAKIALGHFADGAYPMSRD